MPLASLADRGPNSFLEVKFGDPLSEAQRLHPLGSSETSPYGWDSYRVIDIAAGAARYQWVIYEFTPDHGMQLVVARFTPDSRDQILQELHKTLGSPNRPDDSGSAEASSATWATANGATIRFDWPGRQLVLVGPHGLSLEEDVTLRGQLDDQ